MPVRDYAAELVGLCVGSGLTFTFYHFARASKDAIRYLLEAPELEINTELAEKVRECSDGVDACVRGTVKAVDLPIHSLARPHTTGVIWRHTIEEHLMSQVMGFWLNNKLTVDSSSSSVPFMLMKKGVGVQITEPDKLDYAELTVVNEKFDAANNSFVEHLWGWMKGVRTTGTQQTEEMLLEGTSVLGIGRLVLRNEGLQLDPSDTVPYMVTSKSKKSVIEDLEVPIPLLRVLGFLTACGTAYCTYRVLKRWYSAWQKEWERRQQARELAEARAQREAAGSSQDLPESLMCVVCCGLRDVLLLPCRHVCVCSECALRLDPRVCPVCRSHIDRIQPVFYS